MLTERRIYMDKYKKDNDFWQEALSTLFQNNWDYTKKHAMEILNISDPNSPILASILLSSSEYRDTIK